MTLLSNVGVYLVFNKWLWIFLDKNSTHSLCEGDCFARGNCKTFKLQNGYCLFMQPKAKKYSDEAVANLQ